MRLASAVSILLLAAVPGATAAARPPGPAEIDRAGLLGTVERLASPEFKGRLAGSPGYDLAAREMAERLRRAGLRPGGEDPGADGPAAFFQRLTVEYCAIDTCRLALVTPGAAPRPLALGREFTCRGFTGSGSFTAPVVFVGYGLSRPESGYDDYTGVDVRGKVALAFKEEPPFAVDSAGWGRTHLPRPKGLTAAAHGALGLLLVSRPNQEHPQHPIGSTLEGRGEQDEGFPRLQVDGAVAEEMVGTAGLTLAGLESLIDSTRAPASRPLPVEARIEVAARYRADQPSVNVVAILEGADPELRDEYVVLGAHLDHVGAQGGEIYFPGANDNASGAATVVAIAEACARAGARPRRSLVFGLWSAEESGLLGARRFVERPPVPRERIVAYLNFDCVGHGDSIQVGGGRSYPRLWEIARELDADASRLLVGQTWGGGGADAAPFEEAGIPNLYFASRFSYTHLHLTSDTPQTLNPALLEAVARLGYGVAWRLAEEGVPPEE